MGPRLMSRGGADLCCADLRDAASMGPRLMSRGGGVPVAPSIGEFASMGPRLMSRGGVNRAPVDGDGKPLQWGRDS